MTQKRAKEHSITHLVLYTGEVLSFASIQLRILFLTVYKIQNFDQCKIRNLSFKKGLPAVSDNDKSDWSCTLYRLKVKVQIPKLNIARDGKGYPVSVFVSHVTFKSFMISFHKLSQKVQITSSSKK